MNRECHSVAFIFCFFYSKSTCSFPISPLSGLPGFFPEQLPRFFCQIVFLFLVSAQDPYEEKHPELLQTISLAKPSSYRAKSQCFSERHHIGVFLLLLTESSALRLGLQIILWSILGAKDTNTSIINILPTGLQLLRSLML